MNSQQRKTLEQVFANPVNGNLEWRKIESLLLALGCLRTEGSGSSVAFTHSGVSVRFHRPHPQRPHCGTGYLMPAIFWKR